jgi:hypothetical protein
MSDDRQRSWIAPGSWEEVKRSWMNFGKDLRAFASLQIAWLIVWRALRLGRRKTEQAPVSELVTGDKALCSDGKVFDAKQRSIEDQKAVDDSVGASRASSFK